VTQAHDAARAFDTFVAAFANDASQPLAPTSFGFGWVLFSGEQLDHLGVTTSRSRQHVLVQLAIIAHSL